jgi:hypothetical protein
MMLIVHFLVWLLVRVHLVALGKEEVQDAEAEEQDHHHQQSWRRRH